VDKDTVELSNLHRQIIHQEATVGKHKADSAAHACHNLNSTVQVGQPFFPLFWEEKGLYMRKATQS
jgi:tRNA A37 threonylcarbamoyladenosine dehydratase